MAGQKKKKTYSAKEYEELRQKTVALVRCVVLTLDTRGKIGVGSGMVMDMRTKKIERWETQFFDALDAVGVVYDRDEYFAAKKKR